MDNSERVDSVEYRGHVEGFRVLGDYPKGFSYAGNMG